MFLYTVTDDTKRYTHIYFLMALSHYCVWHWRMPAFEQNQSYAGTR